MRAQPFAEEQKCIPASVKPKLGAGKRAPILMTFYLTDDFRPPFGSHCSDFVSYIIKPLIINSLYELLIDG